MALKHAGAAHRAFAQRLLSAEIQFGRRLLGLADPGGARLAPGLARLKLEAHFAAFAHDEVSREGAALFGNEFWQQIGLADGQQFGHLRAVHRLLQNDLAGAEIAGLDRAGRFLADITHPGLEHACAALGTFAERFLAAEIHLRCLPGILFVFLSEVKLRLEFVR